MEKKFKKGDRVMCTDNGKLGVVTEVDIDVYGCVVLFDDGEDTWLECSMLEHSNEPPYNQKTAFLTELKGLLEKYNAVINFGTNGDTNIEMDIAIGHEGVVYSDICSRTFTSENISNYDFEAINE